MDSIDLINETEPTDREYNLGLMSACSILSMIILLFAGCV